MLVFKNTCGGMVTKSKTRNFEELGIDLEAAEERRKPGRPPVATEQFTLRITADMRRRLATMAAKEQESTGRNVTLQQVAVRLLEEALKHG
jgi:predicted HicB family RNase H-like nuclease